MTFFGRLVTRIAAFSLFISLASCGSGSAPKNAKSIDDFSADQKKVMAGVYRITQLSGSSGSAVYFVFFPSTSQTSTGSKPNWYAAYVGANGENANPGGESWSSMVLDGDTLKIWKSRDGSSYLYGTFTKISLTDGSIPENVKEVGRLCEAATDLANALTDVKISTYFSTQDTDKVLAFGPAQTAAVKYWVANIADFKAFLANGKVNTISFENRNKDGRNQIELGSYLSVPNTFGETPDALMVRMKAYRAP